MNTIKEWPCETFAQALDNAREAAGYKNTLSLARAAGLSHTTLSLWYGGKQPSPQSLSAVAKALGVSALKLWRAAGLLTPADDDEVDQDPDTREGLRLIRESGLTPQNQERLIKIFLQQQADSHARLRDHVQAFREAEAVSA